MPSLQSGEWWHLNLPTTACPAAASGDNCQRESGVCGSDLSTYSTVYIYNHPSSSLDHRPHQIILDKTESRELSRLDAVVCSLPPNISNPKQSPYQVILNQWLGRFPVQIHDWHSRSWRMRIGWWNMTWCHVRSEMSKVYRIKEGQEGGAEASERRGEKGAHGAAQHLLRGQQ